MFDTLAMGGNPTAWLAILMIIVVLVGANRIPEIMKSLGSGMKEFKKGLEEDHDEDRPSDHSANPEKH